MPRRYVIEVAVETPEDARTAEAAGANRLELSSALDLGGLTPTIGQFHEVRAATRLPILVMIRPRGGDFVYSDDEARIMARDLDAFRPFEPDGYVFGAIAEDGKVDVERCRAFRELAGNAPCVFHRAFDRCPEPEAALDALIGLGFVRVMTSGREPSALAGSPNICELRKLARGLIELLPCGGIRAKNVETILRISRCNQIHSSFGEVAPELPGMGRRGYQSRTQVSATDLANARATLDMLADELLYD